jgi:anti-sigma-K factor RskA
VNCDQVDELAAAFALDAVEPDERRAIDAHLASCREPHPAARDIWLPAPSGAGVTMISPSAALRARVMATVAATPQLSTQARRVAAPERATPRPGWLERIGVWRPLALGGLAATLVLAVATATLWNRLQDRDARLHEIADAVAGGAAAYSVAGDAGSGLLVDGADGATLVVSNLAPLSGDALYELWLIDAEGNPVAVGTHRPTASDEVAVVPLERDIEGFTIFAVTVEQARVDAPTSDPVLVAEIQG